MRVRVRIWVKSAGRPVCCVVDRDVETDADVRMQVDRVGGYGHRDVMVHLDRREQEWTDSKAG